MLDTLMIIRILMLINTIISTISISINITSTNIINITTTIIIIIITSQVEEEPLRGQEGQLVMGVQQRFSLRPSYITSSPCPAVVMIMMMMVIKMMMTIGTHI